MISDVGDSRVWVIESLCWLSVWKNLPSKLRLSESLSRNLDGKFFQTDSPETENARHSSVVRPIVLGQWCVVFYGQWHWLNRFGETRPGSDLTFWNSTHLKLFQLTFQLSWDFFLNSLQNFVTHFSTLGLNFKIVLSHSKRIQVHAIAIMTPSI